MKASSAFFAALVIASALSAPAMTVTTNLFVETFSKAEGSWSAGQNYTASAADNAWTVAGTVKTALGGVKLGTENAEGSILSGLVPLRVAQTPADLSIYVQAAGYFGKTNGTLRLTALDANDGFLRQWTTNLVPADTSGKTDLSVMASAASFDFTFDFTTAVPFKLLLETGGTGDKRVLVGEVRVSETYDDGRIQLATPVVSVSPDVHQLLLFFTSVDEHATDFELEVLDPEGRKAGNQELYPGFGFWVTDLEEGTTYTVRLRALGDGVVYAPSEWYEEQISTTADNWQPVWTVGTPDSLPTIGKAFSFGVSATLADAEGTPQPQTVSFDGLTPAAPGAQPVFSGGVFSWTPGDEAAGSYTAAFSVVNQGGTYTNNVAFRVRGSTEEVVLFFETFSKCTGNWGATSPGAFSSSYSDSNYVWSVTSAKRGYSGMRLGNKSTYDAAVTPTIRPVNDAACTVSLSFVAAGWDAGDRMTVSVPAASWTQEIVLSNAVDTAASTPLPTGDDYSFGPYEISVPGPFTVSFQRAAGDGRMGIDSVKVTQSVSTSLVDLDVPTGLAVVDGTLSTNSFSVAWNAVANATNYAVEVYEAGGLQPVQTLAFAAPQAAIVGLSDDTDYTVRVRAEGDTEIYNYSAWTNVSARTLRSVLNPTLTVGPWSNAAPGNTLYGAIQNTASVSAALDDGTPVDVFLADVDPMPHSEPSLAGGTLSWTPAADDEGKTFVLSFEMVPAPGAVYATNVSCKVQSLPDLRAPVVTFAEPVAWNKIDLWWDVQYRATRYGVRVWTGGPNPDATATRVEEQFERWPTNRPFGWTFGVKKSDEVYSGTAAPVKLSEDGHFMETYDLGGTVSSVSFHAVGHSMTGGSTLSVVGIAEDGTETPLGMVSNLGSGTSGTNCTFAVPAGAGVRRVAWRYAKINGGVGVGTVVIEGTGFSTAKFLPGWGPTEKNVGLVQSCTVEKPRPGRYLGVNPADKTKDLEEPRVNYAEVRVRDATGTTFATIVAVPVPAPPRAARATMMILQ